MNTFRSTKIIAIFIFLGLVACRGQVSGKSIEILPTQTPQLQAVEAADTLTFSARANPNPKDVLRWLESQKDSCASLSGQHVGHGYETEAKYDELVGGLVQQSGRTVGLVEADYHDWNYVRDAEAFNQPLIDHWNRGGLVGINWSAPNPWTGGDVWDQSQADLNELLDPSTAAHAEWISQLDYVAGGLQHLQDNGVVVLFRPLHEMNGDWFWWGANIHPDDNVPYIKLWRQMHQYFTQTKGLDNLLWVYAASTYAGESWKQPVDYFYPGDDVVDIVGLDVYDDGLNASGYEQMLKLGKPFALAEIGPLNQRDGSFDNLYMLEQIQARYPEAVYWLMWHGWMEDGAYQNLSIVNQQNAVPLMQHECVTTLDEIDMQAALPSSEVSGMVMVPESAVAPQIDGRQDAIWNRAAAQPIRKPLLGGTVPANNLSGQFRLMTADDALYMLIEVSDDQLRADSGQDWWEDDGVEIYIDGDLSSGTSYDGQNDYLIGLRVDDSAAHAGGYSAELPNVSSAWRAVTGGYVFEIAMPLSALGINLSESSRFGIDVHINDDDNGGGRDGKVGWYAAEDVSWQRPYAFGLAVIAKEVAYLPTVQATHD